MSSYDAHEPIEEYDYPTVPEVGVVRMGKSPTEEGHVVKAMVIGESKNRLTYWVQFPDGSRELVPKHKIVEATLHPEGPQDQQISHVSGWLRKAVNVLFSVTQIFRKKR